MSDITFHRSGKTRLAQQDCDDSRFHLQLLKTGPARELLLELIEQFGGVAGGLVKEEMGQDGGAQTLADGLPGLIEKLTKAGLGEMYGKVVDTFRKVSRVVVDPNGEDIEFQLKEDDRYEEFFQGDLLLEAAWVSFCMRAQYGRFLDDIKSGRAGGLFPILKATAPSKSPKGSTGSSGASS